MTNRDAALPFYEHSFPPVRFYWHSVLKGIVDSIEADKSQLILDFGCGRQQLKKYLPSHYIIGYDIVREYSDVTDFSTLTPHTIICSHVLEHMALDELYSVLQQFKVMNPACLITAQPTENWLSKISNLIGRSGGITSDLRAKDHRVTMIQVHDAVSNFFKLKSRINILSLTIISKWS